MGRSGCSHGASVVEALVALLLGLMLTTLSLGIAARQRAVQAALAERMGFLDTARVLRHVVGTELRSAWAPEDVTLHAPDSVAVRAFRGLVRVCATLAWNRVLVTTEGSRLPDASKDSLVFLRWGGEAQVVELVLLEAAGSRRCGARPGRPMVLSVSDSVPTDVVLARYFEKGSYHLSGGALRYRRGRSGRQPLTPESLDTPPSAFAPGREGGMEIALAPRRATGRTWRLSLGRGSP